VGKAQNRSGPYSDLPISSTWQHTSHNNKVYGSATLHPNPSTQDRSYLRVDGLCKPAGRYVTYHKSNKLFFIFIKYKFEDNCNIKRIIL